MQEKIFETLERLEQEEPNAAMEYYQKLLNESEGEFFGEIAFRCALFLHRFREEEMALDLFAACFQTGMHREEIKEICRKDFWEPFIEEGKKQYQIQTEVMKEQFPELIVPDFEKLPYYFFPVSKEQYLLFDREEERFLDWLYLGEEAFMSINVKEPQPFFSIIMDCEKKNRQEILSYCYQNNERRIYMIETEKYEWISLLALPDILWKCMENVVLLQGMEAVKKQFVKTKERLPYINKIGNEALKREVADFLTEEHERRILDREGRRMPLLTIGIPSWNRGGRALQLVEKLQTLPFDAELEILVSNNGSDLHVEEYHKIRDMEDSRLSYFESAENRKFHGNVETVLKKAAGRWILLLSDEDMLDFTLLPEYMEKLERYQEKVAVIRPGSGHFYRDLEEKYAYKGEEAILAFSMGNNYMSGVTYNRKYMTQELVEHLEKALGDNYSYRAYTHMIFDWYMCLAGDFYRYRPSLVMEGEAEGPGDDKTGSLTYNTFENRIRQHFAYIDILNKMEGVEDRLKLTLFLTISGKLCVLIGMRKKFYKSEEESWEARCEEIQKAFRDSYDMLRLEEDYKQAQRREIFAQLSLCMKKYIYD